MLKFGVIGYGYWGPNIVRNLVGVEGTRVLAVADNRPVARERSQKANPGMQVTADASEVISSTEIDAVAIITPVWTHFCLLYTSDAADEEDSVDLGGRRII